ncbi:MAG: CpaF family protein, partial [Sulfuriferula sp.]
LAMMETMSPEQLREELKIMVERLLAEETLAINDVERKSLVRDIQHEVLGLGPLEPLMADPTISDILVNTYRQVYVERKGKLELTDVRFENEAHLIKSSTR